MVIRICAYRQSLNRAWRTHGREGWNSLERKRSAQKKMKRRGSAFVCGFISTGSFQDCVHWIHVWMGQVSVTGVFDLSFTEEGSERASERATRLLACLSVMKGTICNATAKRIAGMWHMEFVLPFSYCLRTSLDGGLSPRHVSANNLEAAFHACVCSVDRVLGCLLFLHNVLRMRVGARWCSGGEGGLRVCVLWMGHGTSIAWHGNGCRKFSSLLLSYF